MQVIIHVHFFMFLNYGISAHANVYMQPLKCGNSAIFAGASDEANISTSSDGVTIFMKSVRYYGLVHFFEQLSNKFILY